MRRTRRVRFELPGDPDDYSPIVTTHEQTRVVEDEHGAYTYPIFNITTIHGVDMPEFKTYKGVEDEENDRRWIVALTQSLPTGHADDNQWLELLKLFDEVLMTPREHYIYIRKLASLWLDINNRYGYIPGGNYIYYEGNEESVPPFPPMRRGETTYQHYDRVIRSLNPNDNNINHKLPLPRMNDPRALESWWRIAHAQHHEARKRTLLSKGKKFNVINTTKYK